MRLKQRLLSVLGIFVAVLLCVNPTFADDDPIKKKVRDSLRNMVSSGGLPIPQLTKDEEDAAVGAILMMAWSEGKKITRIQAAMVYGQLMAGDYMAEECGKEWEARTSRDLAGDFKPLQASRTSPSGVPVYTAENIVLGLWKDVTPLKGETVGVVGMIESFGHENKPLDDSDGQYSGRSQAVPYLEYPLFRAMLEADNAIDPSVAVPGRRTELLCKNFKKTYFHIAADCQVIEVSDPGKNNAKVYVNQPLLDVLQTKK